MLQKFLPPVDDFLDFASHRRCVRMHRRASVLLAPASLIARAATTCTIFIFSLNFNTMRDATLSKPPAGRKSYRHSASRAFPRPRPIQPAASFDAIYSYHDSTSHTVFITSLSRNISVPTLAMLNFCLQKLIYYHYSLILKMYTSILASVSLG